MGHSLIRRGVVADVPFTLKDKPSGNLVDDADWTDGLTAAEWPEASWKNTATSVDVTSDMVRDITGDTITSATHKHPDPSTGIWRNAQGRYYIRIEPDAGLNLTDYDLDVTFDVSATESYAETHQYELRVAGDVGFGDEDGYGEEDQVAARSGVTYTDLGLASEGELVTFIQGLNRRASALIDQYTGRDFRLHTDAVHALDGTNRRTLILPGSPVVSVSQVLENGSLLDSAEYRVKDDHDAPHPGHNSGLLERRPPQCWRRSSTWENYQVTYTWGYENPPNDIRKLAEDLILRSLQAAKVDASATGASGESMDGFSVTYDRAALSMALSDMDRAVLSTHRRIVVA